MQPVEAEELARAANALLNNLWAGSARGIRTHEENWDAMERDYPGVKSLHEAIASWNRRSGTGSEAVARPQILKGVGKITGDGWKDTTRKGEIVYVWNAELPEPYAPGQYPRIGYEHWSASTEQYDFQPATVEEVRPLYASPVPTSGVREALDFADDAISRAEEELRLIRMKDSAAVYDSILRSLIFGLWPEKLAKARAALASALPVLDGGWRDIEKDPPPKDGTEVLLFGPGVFEGKQYAPGRHVGWWDDDVGLWRTRDPMTDCEPRCWQPLPTSPEVSDAE